MTTASRRPKQNRLLPGMINPWPVVKQPRLSPTQWIRSTWLAARILCLTQGHKGVRASNHHRTCSRCGRDWA